MKLNQETYDVVNARQFSPTLPEKLRLLLYEYVLEYVQTDPDTTAAFVRELSLKVPDKSYEKSWRASCLVLADLVEQGWEFFVEAGRGYLSAPSIERQKGENSNEVKARIRKGLRMLRDRQLQDPSVQKFLIRMQRSRKYKGETVSVLSLVDDGRELADMFRSAQSLSEEDRALTLRSIIKPEIEVCDPGKLCSTTGLKLYDIWRYFRHTWSLEYRPSPGRSLPLLIRNAARPRRPVIGIAMLASAAMRLGPRDEWIGWEPESLRAKLNAGEVEPAVAAKALGFAIRQSLKNVRSDDLVSEDELKLPVEATIFRLEQRAEGAAYIRRKELEAKQSDTNENPTSVREHPLDSNDQIDWRTASERPLFVRKRAELLARLLFARKMFNEVGLRRQPIDALKSLYASESGCRALDIALAEVRKRGLASQLADVSVCGAIAPYNEILGGKLVTLLITSSEVRRSYRKRYSGYISEIASQMAGKPIKRKADLLALTTTSLYGSGTSQYNRLKLKAEQFTSLGADIEWMPLGLSSGYGTVHLSGNTVSALRELSIEKHGARRINQVFGEGSSPRMRQVREGLDVLGVKSDTILNHATPRLVFGCEVVSNATARFMGFDSSWVPRKGAKAEDITQAWIQRWLTARITRHETLSKLDLLGPEYIRGQLWANEHGQYSLPF